MRRARTIALALVATLCTLAPDARAADPDKNVTEVALYGWAAMVAGKFDTSKGSSTAYVPFSDVWDSLNFAAMGRARTQYDKFSLVGDVEYIKLESDHENRTIRVGPRGGIEIPVSAKFELQQWIAELSAGYQVLSLEDVLLEPKLEMYAGGRYYSISPELDYTFNGNGGHINSSHAWVDGIVGTRIGLALSKTVEMGIQGDVGGFKLGNSSRFAWSQITSLSWRFAESWRFHLGYKFLEFKKGSADNEIKLQLRGPFTAVSVLF